MINLKSRKGEDQRKSKCLIIKDKIMGEETLIEKIKRIVYKIVLPVYLWSIGFKTLEDYITVIENQPKI